MTTEHTEQENKRATMKDVARRAGVTIGTVSHVINGTAPISEETTARVREAIRALNYVPNLAARHMRRKEKRQIGLLIPKLDHNFYARIASVLMEDAYQEDYTVLMLSYEYSSEKEKRGLVNMVQNDTFTRYPNIKWVIPHAGAFLPILADRFESFALMLRFADPDRRADIMEDMAHVYFDAAGFSEPKQLEMLLRNVPDTHILYGSDTPYTDITACVGQAEALEQTEKLTDEQKEKLFTGNALALLPKLNTK